MWSCFNVSGKYFNIWGLVQNTGFAYRNFNFHKNGRKFFCFKHTGIFYSSLPCQNPKLHCFVHCALQILYVICLSGFIRTLTGIMCDCIFHSYYLNKAINLSIYNDLPTLISHFLLSFCCRGLLCCAKSILSVALLFFTSSCAKSFWSKIFAIIFSRSISASLSSHV